MNIAVVIKNTTFHKNYGGMETQNKVLCENLVSKGHKVTVYSPRKGVSVSEVMENGVKYKFVDCVYRRFNALYSKSNNGWYKKSFEIVKSDHESNNFDILVSQSSSALGIIRHKNELGLKVVSIAHGSKMSEVSTVLNNISSLKEFVRFVINIPHILYSFFVTQREFINNSNKVIAVSNYVKNSIISETFVPETKVEVIYNGVDNRKFQSFKIKSTSDKYNLLYVGRILREKGLFLLIDSLKTLDEKILNKLYLNIIGTGDKISELKKYVEINNLSKFITIHGHKPYNEVILYYKTSNLLLLPSLRKEGLPMVLIEGMFCGLPVVASNVGGISEAVFNGKNGILIDNIDKFKLGKAIKKMVLDGSLNNVYKKNAFEIANSMFTIDIMVDSYIKVFKEVINAYS